MSKYFARAALDQLVNRPVLVSPDYASRGIGLKMEVTSGGMMADIHDLADANQAVEIAATKDRNIVMASSFGFDVVDDSKSFAFSNGYAIIPIHGLLLNRFSWSWSFVTGYNFIRSQLIAALADDDVTAVIFDVNSHGGVVAGCTETADLMFNSNAANGGKPLIAVIDANCHSAAYFLAAQCDHIAITPSGDCANIGVFRLHFDTSKMMEEMGVDPTFIIAGSHKVDGNPFEPLSDDVLAEFQAEVNSMYDTFVAAVARGRGLDEQVVRDTEARCYGAVDALALGLVDAVQNPSDAVEAYFVSNDADDDNADDDDATPDDTEPTEPQESNMAVRPATTQTTQTAAAATPAAEVTSVDTAAVANDARTAERTRIAAIQGHAEAAGRTSLASHLALQTDMSVESAAGILAASPKEAAPVAAVATDVTEPVEENHFRNAMDRSQSPNVGASAGGDTDDGTRTPASRILASQARAMGYKAPANATH